MKKILTSVVLALACCIASATSTTISGTKTNYPIGFPLATGQFCYNGACAAITNGAFSGTFTEGTATVTITTGALTVLSIPSVTISTTTYNWDNFIVPSTAQISGIGSPSIACNVGAFFLQTDAPPSNGPWTCQNQTGVTSWFPGGPPGVSPSGRYINAGAPGFTCYSPCEYIQTDASPSTAAWWIAVGSRGFPTSTWALQSNSGGPISASTLGTSTRCTSSASPAACVAAPSGFVVVAASATTVVVNTTVVTANSQIWAQEDSSLGTALGVTCNTTPATAPTTISGRTPGTSFTITTTAPTTNPRCFSYGVIN